MSRTPSHIVKDLAQQQTQNAIKKYTEAALKKEQLTYGEKIKLVALNQHDRLNIIAQVQKHTLEHVFKKYPDSFFSPPHHYDWWVFPMHVLPKWDWVARNYEASVNPEEAKILLSDSSFVETFLNCIHLYNAGLEQYGWNNYLIRYARMLNSLALFLHVADGTEVRSEALSLTAEAQKSITFAKKNIMPLLHDEVVESNDVNRDRFLFKRGYALVKEELKRLSNIQAPSASL